MPLTSTCGMARLFGRQLRHAYPLLVEPQLFEEEFADLGRGIASGSTPMAIRRSRTFGCPSAAFTSRCSLSVTSAGRLAGPNMPNQPPSTLYAGNPASAVVGTSGAD